VYPPGWTSPQVLGPLPGCSSSSPGIHEVSGTLKAPPDSATLSEAALGLPHLFPEVFLSVNSSQGS
jgi:hypothetical protein